MTPAEKAFLVLSQELNFHKAAQKCYFTQQALSSHIHSLEESCGTALFVRRPQVGLTPAGRALQSSLLRQQILEEDLARELARLREGRAGQVQLGINSTRASILLPPILEKFRQASPGAELIVHMEDTRRMEQALDEGELDCLIGINAVNGGSRTHHTLLKEGIWLLVPQALLPGNGFLAEGEKAVSDLRSLAGIPFVRNLPGSTLNGKVDEVLSEQGVCLQQLAAVSDYETQLEFCRRGWAAAFCPQMIVEQQGKRALKKQGICALPVRGLETALRLDLVWDRERLYPACVKSLLDCAREALAEKGKTKKARSGCAQSLL